MKPKEAFEKIETELTNYLGDGMTEEKNIVKLAFVELEELKRISTVDEILKLLSEIAQTEVLYSTVTHEFYYIEKETEMNEEYVYEQFITETYGDGKWSFNMYLPLNVIQMIIRFYEEIERGKK